MRWISNDGGREAAGYRGQAGDCAVRAISIATGMGYQPAYDLVKIYSARERPSKRRRGTSNARTGVHSHTMRKIMAALGWTWVPTMHIGSGCQVHLTDGELPKGHLIVRVSKHYTAVIDGVIHDTFNPQRESHYVRTGGGGAGGPDEMRPGEWRNPNGICGISRRGVYGYWTKP